MRTTRAVHATALVGLILKCAMPSAAAGDAAATRPPRPETALTRIRIEDNERIQEVFRYAFSGSVSFQDVVATIESGDRSVYVTEGRCPGGEQHACLQLAKGQSHANLIVRIDPRQSIMTVATLLAHELYHAAEILREPDVDDVPSLRHLYARIGYRMCAGESDSCWETRGAVAFQELVWTQLSARVD